MPREKEGYRDNLELLNRRFPDYDMLSIRDSMQVMNWRSVNTAKKHIRFVNGRVSKAALARLMCG